MFIPARRTRGPVPVCTRLPRLLSVATTGAVFLGAGFGVMPSAAADPAADQVSVTVDIVGDSYMAGDGLADSYIDPADPRHRSTAAPALQALARVQEGNSRLRVDANLVAASGAQTVDYFTAQLGPDNAVVNAPQHDQVRPDAQLVIVGFGGDDAHLAKVLADAMRTTGGPNTALDKEIRELAPLLDWTGTDEDYLAQAKSSPPGQAPTLVARMLQVLAGIAARAPQARIVVTTYPLAADPQDEHAASLVGEDELTSVRKFGYDLNKAIDRAVQICGCGSLVDLSEAVAGHEIYTSDSAFNQQQPTQQSDQAAEGAFQPNDKGASLIANPIANGIASVLQISAPKPSDGRVTVPKNIDIHNGVSDRDGDTVADYQDRAPDDPARSTDTPETRHGTDDRSHHGTKSNHGNDNNHSDNSRNENSRNDNSHNGVLQPIIQVVDGLAPGLSPIGAYDRPTKPAGDNHPVSVESRPPAREHTGPLEPTALAPEPAAAPPVPGEDGGLLSPAQNAAMQDVISKAEPAGYVSLYSAQALRATTVPADESRSLDKSAVDSQMSKSFLNDQYNGNIRDGFRNRFSENIDAIHNATTVAEQDAAIAQFNQTAREYNATELAERDAYGGHPVDAQGETVRVTPTSLAAMAAEATTFGPVDATTLSTVSDQAQVGTVADTATEARTFGPVDVSTLSTVSDQAQVGTVTDVTTEATTFGQVDANTVSTVSDQSGQTQAGTVDGSNMASVNVTGPSTKTTVKGNTEIGGVPVSGEVSVDRSPTSPSVSVSGKVGPVGDRSRSESTEVGGLPVSGNVNVKGPSAEANANIGVSKDGFNAKIGAKGTLGEGTAETSTTIGPVDAGAKAKASVNAEAGANAKIGTDGFDVGAKAFAGAKAGIEGRADIAGVTIAGTAEGWVGPGWENRYRFGFDEKGDFTIGVDAGVSTLIGGKLGWSITVNPDKFSKSVKDALDALESLSPWGPAEDNVQPPQVDKPDTPQLPAPEVPTSELESPQPELASFTDMPDLSEQPALSEQAPQADLDSEYSGPTPGTTGENDDPGYGLAPAEAPADNDAQYSGPTPGTTGENDDPGYGPAPASNEPGEAPAAADNDANYSGPTPGTTGENDDPGYSPAPVNDAPVDSDAAISSNTDPASETSSDTVAGEIGTDTVTGNAGEDSLGGETDSGFSDSGFGDTSDSSGGYSTGDSMGGLGDSGSDGGIGGETGGMSDSGGMGGDSGVGGDSGGMGGDSSGMGGDSGGMGGDSGGGVGGGDSSGGMGSGSMGGGDGGGDGGSSSGGGDGGGGGGE